MMPGYEWWPMLKITHPNRSDVVIDMRYDFAYAGGPVRVHGPNYALQTLEREDINRAQYARSLGIRVSAGLEFAIGDDMEDHQFIVRIVNAALDPESTLALSLDGGAVYRRVVLTAHDGPDAFGGKTFAGARYRLDFRCADLIDEVPEIGTGSW
jgi:hypothetical protein